MNCTNGHTKSNLETEPTYRQVSHPTMPVHAKWQRGRRTSWNECKEGKLRYEDTSRRGSKRNYLLLCLFFIEVTDDVQLEDYNSLKNRVKGIIIGDDSRKQSCELEDHHIGDCLKVRGPPYWWWSQSYWTTTSAVVSETKDHHTDYGLIVTEPPHRLWYQC